MKAYKNRTTIPIIKGCKQRKIQFAVEFVRGKLLKALKYHNILSFLIEPPTSTVISHV